MRLPGELHDGEAAAAEPAARLHAPTYTQALLQELAMAGYGAWILLGGTLALGIYHGRGEALVPLALGGLFVSAGLLGAWLGLPGASPWRGWQLASNRQPTAGALLGLAAYLPMLGVAGLVRGDNAFWATRLAGTLLLATAVANVLHGAYAYRSRLNARARLCPAQLPLARLVAACYGGGLWLWLCLANQTDAALPAGTRPWMMGLLALALVQGLFEGMRWQLAHAPANATRTGPERARARAARFVGALFSYAIPSVALLSVDLTGRGALLVMVAALSWLAGRTIEQRAYRETLAFACDSRTA